MTHKGAVAAGHEVTAAAAFELLEDGGNAFDAAIAGVLAACVAEPILASPGGGGFMTARKGDAGRGDTTRVFDFFAQTPRRKRARGDIDFREVHVDFGSVTQAFHIGLGAAATPGLLPGLFRAHERLGRVPMTRIAEPAIRAAKEGVRVTAFQAYLLTVVEPILTASPALRALFTDAEGRLLTEGAVQKNAALADALDALAREGEVLATKGEIAQAMARQADDEGGHLTLDDLRFYEVATRTPLEARAGDLRIETVPPPSTGGVMVALGLDRLEASHRRRRVPAPDIAATLLWMNTLRAECHGDPDALLARRAQLEADGQKKPQALRGTTHVSVVDGSGNAASVTVSNGEGCGALVPGCGFMLNNMLGEDDINPGGFHQWAENMRMCSMMSPMLAHDDAGKVMALGSGGSNRIRSALLQTALLLGRGAHPEEAVMHPRLHVEGTRADEATKLSFEEGWPDAERDAMTRDFDITEPWPDPNMFFGGVHIAARDERGSLEGAGDPRRAGVFLKG
ncbi:Gamma-glutamyltranspeptidase [Pyruvatibacter mobilis]|uniref:Gamma-glutamyltranspeptidase n=1 Tax=Pyruvatibacter mobilis TaxID=1712261 RepID=A0A845Q9G4_9HYPH|nr:gamma-glutamyltransferase [Pyruvatibacter mobilis]NBG94830.1 Gamma-glutamyltranspeptidase [Pyruvatibacter mobilis]QJD76052.1 Gamma-glutamyltranspeptidase [Pyruvatibacter mobilis]GGD20733.1 gamma-glutamyltranspeptidase [Pyruvatibacter mobilis]